mmetsp:Transcript_12211/g.37243  ORF Transcript_12211/g.37243 Transcript_12211/m.37243 type:complete len:230 (-) Transcript_12211:1514-2203(-)
MESMSSNRFRPAEFRPAALWWYSDRSASLSLLHSPAMFRFANTRSTGSGRAVISAPRFSSRNTNQPDTTLTSVRRAAGSAHDGSRGGSARTAWPDEVCSPSACGSPLTGAGLCSSAFPSPRGGSCLLSCCARPPGLPLASLFATSAPSTSTICSSTFTLAWRRTSPAPPASGPLSLISTSPSTPAWVPACSVSCPPPCPGSSCRSVRWAAVWSLWSQKRMAPGANGVQP